MLKGYNMEIIKKEIKKKRIWFYSILAVIVLSVILYEISKYNGILISTFNSLTSLPISLVSMLLTIILYGKFEEKNFMMKLSNDETLKNKENVIEFIKSLRDLHEKIGKEKKYVRNNNISEIANIKTFFNYIENTTSEYAIFEDTIKLILQRLRRNQIIEDPEAIIELLSDINSVIKNMETKINKDGR